jgi:hypothetical protein
MTGVVVLKIAHIASSSFNAHDTLPPLRHYTCPCSVFRTIQGSLYIHNQNLKEGRRSLTKMLNMPPIDIEKSLGYSDARARLAKA